MVCFILYKFMNVDFRAIHDALLLSLGPGENLSFGSRSENV